MPNIRCRRDLRSETAASDRLIPVDDLTGAEGQLDKNRLFRKVAKRHAKQKVTNLPKGRRHQRGMRGAMLIIELTHSLHAAHPSQVVEQRFQAQWHRGVSCDLTVGFEAAFDEFRDELHVIEPA